ncbi:MAG: outer membrane protein assembly factor BamA [SAR86 cluster bacterium]|jgi:outer membrane protein insertion porin family|nr:outer membrane protein assembly factor BamA [Gammaproteobacteria bacterium]MDG2456799.1 outer membrane protein assembly factor BamA [SAR86 cluster bacterium]|tara:strand:+ start:84 stop:2504 length:2421 start_codon:yes stop_codon:yes gene_type:complete
MFKSKITSLFFSGFLLLSLSLSQSINSEDEKWLVEDIRISGLQRVSAGSIFNVLPLAVGDNVDSYDLQNAAKVVFKTGQFDDIQVGRDGNTLILSITERPSIASIELDGNKAIKTEDLIKGLNEAGLSQGQVFKRSILNGLAQEIQRQYVSQGRYGALVEVDTESKPRNRVALNIEIEEGEVAVISNINLVGNKTFADEEILEIFELGTGGWFSFITNDDRYSREKLKGDIESLTSFYKNRGYVEFKLDSSQVTITPDKQSVFITLNITEGETYEIGEINIAGDLPIEEAVLRSLILVQPGDIFSQYYVTETEEIFTNILGNEGYSFAEINGVTDVNDETGKVDLTFYVDPQQRTYVRRIVFKGNKRTHDVVLRREMRQMEGAWASNNLIENSKLRLERLGYFKEVESEEIPVAGVSDQIDVEFSVEEEFSGSVGGSLGYGAYGLVLGLNYNENNAFGTGKAIGIGINDSTWQRSYSFNYGEPYYNIDGVSRGYNAYFRASDYGQFNIASYTSDAFGAGIQFGLPISDIERIGLNLNYDNTEIDTGSTPASQIIAFTASEGTKFEVLKSQFIWSKISLNRGLFPTAGQSQAFALQLAIPGSSLTYAKATYRHKYFKPIFGGNIIFGLRGEIGVLEPYGDTEIAPFFEHFYSGGISSVRGFKQNTLGPRATPSLYYLGSDGNPILDDNGNPIANPYAYYDNDRSIGGAYLVEAGFDFIFKLPFIEDQRSMRSSFFIDIGNVFSKDCGNELININCSELDLAELRYSYGIGATWITQLGPMSVAISKPTNAGPLDETESFQFEIGTQF